MLFRDQTETFLTEIATRRRQPARPATLRIYRSYLQHWILPQLGSLDLSKVENGVAKKFIALLAKNLAPATVQGIFNVVKLIVASAVDENGNQLFPRQWNADFCDLPIVQSSEQDAPIVLTEAIQTALQSGDRALLALLAGAGLRIGEACALQTEDDGKNSFWDSRTGMIQVRTTLDWATQKIQFLPKTEAGNRQVDLQPELNAYLIDLLPEEGLLFRNRLGGTVHYRTISRRLVNAGIETGFHAFRRFRVTHLRAKQVPEDLIQYWLGHSRTKTITDRYSRLHENLEIRKDWANKAGLGFSLTGGSNVAF